jgi:genome maintenance exonuclease 1
MFNHSTENFLEYSDLECITTEKGRRYITPDGIAYPSITTVLSLLSVDQINKWKKRVGEEEANRISKFASNRGTLVHEIIEKYLDNREDYTSGYMPNIVSSLVDLKPTLSRIDEIYLQECALYSDHLKLAGRVDCVGKFDGELSIIDFKTSMKPKKKEWISNYFMQCAAYAIMWEERTSIAIENLVILIAVDGHEPQVFTERRDNWTKKLLETRELYRNQKE